MAASKLYIYDSSSDIDRSQAAGRFSGESGVETLAVPSIAALHVGLAGLVAAGRTFKRVLFQTHGNSGSIFFNHHAISASDLQTSFKGLYSQLFPGRTKVYFDGCNVAEGKAGWDFLAAAGEAFLQLGGGITMGYTSLGSGLPGWLPFIGGHTVHLWGHLKVIEFGQGGVASFRFPDGHGVTFLQMADLAEKLDSF